jgi:hypothetical protein
VDVGDLEAGRIVWEDRHRARIGRLDKGLRRHGIVDCWGDGDAKVTKKTIAEVGMYLYRIFVEFEV